MTGYGTTGNQAPTDTTGPPPVQGDAVAAQVGICLKLSHKAYALCEELEADGLLAATLTSPADLLMRCRGAIWVKRRGGRHESQATCKVRLSK